LEDIAQRRWKRNPVVHRKTESVCLIRSVIRILTDNHHFHLIGRTSFKRRKYLVFWRITYILGILSINKVLQRFEIRLCCFRLEKIGPRSIKWNFHYKFFPKIADAAAGFKRPTYFWIILHK